MSRRPLDMNRLAIGAAISAPRRTGSTSPPSGRLPALLVAAPMVGLYMVLEWWWS